MMSPPSIYCSKGHENPADNRFCRLCGESLPSLALGNKGNAAGDPHLNILVGQRYRLQRQLGHGGFGRTYLAEDTNRFNELCVLKEFAPQVSEPSALKKAEQLFEREAGVLYQLQHPQIPCFRELLRAEMEGPQPDNQPSQARLFLVQDYVKGYNYQDLLEQRQLTGQAFTETDILQLLRDILPVLAYIHEKGVIHRDISPDNLMQRDSDRLPVLIDFGGVKQAAMSAVSGAGDNSQAKSPSVTIVGKQGYAPHEQMISGQVSPHSDFYALAVTILVLMTGQTPAHVMDPNSPGFWQTRLTLSPPLNRVLRKMLAPYPSDRYSTANDILAVLFPPAPPLVTPVTPVTPASPVPPASPPASAARTVAIAPGNRPTNVPLTPAPAGFHPNQQPIIMPAAPGINTANTPTYPGNVPPAHPAPRTPSINFPSIRKRTFPKIPFGLIATGVIVVVAGTGAWAGYVVISGWIEGAQARYAAIIDWIEGLKQWPQFPDTSVENENELDPSVQFSEAEQKRKAQLRDRRDRLSISERFLVQLTDASFYEQYPGQRGRALTANPNDAEWRQKWDAIATQWLDQLDNLFPQEIRTKLGSYGKADRDRWGTMVNNMNVSSKALYDLTDIQFFSTFPDRQGQDILNQPIGQLWHGMATQQLAQMQAGENLDTVQFARGAFQTKVKQRLRPGTGYVYLLNAQAGQLMRLNLNAPRTRLSIYVPRPTTAVPLLLEDSLDQSWSGELPQSGYYEIVVILDDPALNNRAADNASTIQMTVAVENTANQNDGNTDGDRAPEKREN